MISRAGHHGDASNLFSEEGEREILSEPDFHQMISVERKRTERTGRPFLLMLLDQGNDYRTAKTREVLRNIPSSLLASTRETDMTGWYREHSVVGVMFTELAFDEKQSFLNTMSARVICVLKRSLSSEQLNQIHISCHLFPEDDKHDIPRAPSNKTLYPDLARRDDARKLFQNAKRMMDIVGSVCALLLSFPVLLAIALAIKLSSKGPVFFRQQRVGQYGKRFTFLKLRSMRADNDPHIHKEYVRRLIAGEAEQQPSNGFGGGVYKLTNDERVTRIGAFLRRTSLDEVPQFINVLKGEMSLVGPRPPLPYEVEHYDLWHHRRILEAKPGITGLWQVNGRSRIEFDEMVRMDLRYARTWSPWLDIKILLRTPLAVLMGEGAY